MAFERKLEYGFIWLNHSLLTSGKTWLIRLHALGREFCANLAYLDFAFLSDPQQLLSHRKFIIYCQARAGSPWLGAYSSES